MENILDLYSKNYNISEPVVCLDEKPIQLLGYTKPGKKMKKSGQIKKTDYEYKRNGTANIFCAVEPKAGKHITQVTKKKRGKDFAIFINKINNKYKHVRKIHLVMDNYCTHFVKSLISYYGEERAKQIWSRFEIHYTPVHASWLNQAEIEINMCSKMCIGRRRFENIEILKSEVQAWNKIMNKKKAKITWRFTTVDAREKFKYSKI
jgi:hypothetical protein